MIDYNKPLPVPISVEQIKDEKNYLIPCNISQVILDLIRMHEEQQVLIDAQNILINRLQVRVEVLEGN